MYKFTDLWIIIGYVSGNITGLGDGYWIISYLGVGLFEAQAKPSDRLRNRIAPWYFLNKAVRLLGY
jgi:hypothetical protein